MPVSKKYRNNPRRYRIEQIMKEAREEGCTCDMSVGFICKWCGETRPKLEKEIEELLIEVEEKCLIQI